MTSFAKALLFLFLLVLFSSLQVEARLNLFFSKVTHSNVNEPEIPTTEDPAPPSPSPSFVPTYSPFYEPTYAPAYSPIYSPTYAPTYAPAPELTAADAPEEGELLIPPPAPEPFDSEPELGYELYGSADQETETPITMDIQNEVATQGDGQYENTNLFNDNSKYTTNYNTDRYSTNDINGREGFSDSYYSNGNGNSGEGFQQHAKSDTRFQENGSFSQDDDVKNRINDNLNGYQSSRESTINEAYFGNSEKPNEFNTMKEYEKYQENQGYVP